MQAPAPPDWIMDKPGLHGKLPTQLPAAQREWFGELERVALAGLRDGVTIVELAHRLSGIRMTGRDAMHAAFRLLHGLLLQRFPSYSLWRSAGSGRISPVSLIIIILPSPQCFTALLAGSWEQRDRTFAGAPPQ